MAEVLSFLGVIVVPMMEAYLLRWAVRKEEEKRKTTSYIYLAMYHIPLGALLLSIGGVMMQTAINKPVTDPQIVEGIWWAINGAIWSAFGFMYLGLALFRIIEKTTKKKKGVIAA